MTITSFLTTTTFPLNMDDNGNMVKKTVGSDVTNYIYNIKDVGGVRTYFLYSDEGLVGEYDSSGQEIRFYGYKPGSNWGTDLLFMKEVDNYYFYHNDHDYLSITQKITAINGTVVWEAKYTSFGEAIIEPSSIITNNLRFPGQYFDSETGLHYNYHRYYDSGVGRFLRADPLDMSMVILIRQYFQGSIVSGHLYQYSLENPLIISNLYPYVGSNPISWADPLGLKRIWWKLPMGIFHIVHGGAYVVSGILVIPWALASGPGAPVIIVGVGVPFIAIGSFLVYLGYLDIVEYIKGTDEDKDASKAPCK